MLHKKYFTGFVAFALLLMSSLLIAAQSAPVRGKVELKKADGSVAPVDKAVIDVYRTDIKAKLPSAKTNKKGEFSFAGLPLGATMSFAVSGPGIKAELLPGVRAGGPDITITVYEGDGKALTEDEVRGALTTTPKQTQTTEETADQKKAREEYEKELKDHEDKKKKVEAANAIVKKSAEEGSSAFNQKNWDVAIVKFEEAINADTEFLPNVTMLTNNKALALRLRGIEAYNKGERQKAHEDLKGSLESSQKVIELIATVTDPAEVRKYDEAKKTAFANTVEVRGLLIFTGGDNSDEFSQAAVKDLNQYLTIETNATEKVKVQISLADRIFEKGNAALAVPVYRKVLESNPNNVDAMGGLGLALTNLHLKNTVQELTAEDKPKLQEATTLLSNFVKNAPDTHKNKEAAKGILAFLTGDLKFKP